MKNEISQPTSVNPFQHLVTRVRVDPRFWTIARWLWWLIFIAIVVMNLLAIAPTFQLWQRECVTADCNDQQLKLFLFRDWLAMGFPRASYAGLALVINFIPIAAYLIVGAILFFAKPKDRMCFLTSLSLIMFGGVTYAGLVNILARDNPLWWYPILFLNFWGSLGIIIFFFLFPNGEFVPRSTRTIFALLAINQVLELLSFPPIHWDFLPRPFVDGVFILTILCLVLAQIYRYRRVSNAKERQQTKWVVYGTSVGLVSFILSTLVFISIPGLGDRVLAEIGLSFLLSILISAVPISIAIAMLRSRLWDIDLIINRTIVYGTMTAIVAGLLAVLSDLARKFFLALTGESSELAPIVATLLIVALFEPIRKRVQEFVDRHFKYATAGTLGAFADKVSDFVQLSDADALARRFLRETLTSFDVESGAIYLGEGISLRLVSSTPTRFPSCSS